jgi:septal ring factor EnvC (AmiA/AmiB activator)
MFYGTRILAAVQVAMLGYVIYKLTQMEKIMATVPAGLTALQKADSDLAAEVVTVVADIATLSAQLSALNSEDPAVAALAADIETKVEALQAAVAPPAPAPAS